MWKRLADWAQVSVVLLAAVVLLWVAATVVRGLFPLHPAPGISLRPAPTVPGPPWAASVSPVDPGQPALPQTGRSGRRPSSPPGEPPTGVEDATGPPPARAAQPPGPALPIQSLPPPLSTPSLLAVSSIKP